MTEIDSETLISGKYRVTSVLGEGAMGVVYDAEQLDHDGRVLRHVAIKMIKPDLSAKGSFSRRFQIETHVLARLASPNVVTVFDAGRSENGQLYFTMEIVQGDTLATLLEKEGPLSVRRACRIAMQVCRALAEAHGQEPPVIHRDLKPANIFVFDRDGRDFVKVGDFGVAKIASEDSTASNPILDVTADSPDLTIAGASPGTPRYMSPEQCMGEQIDARSDLYSVGILLYEMITGRPSVDLAGGAAAVMYRQVHEATEPLPRSIPKSVRSLVTRLLSKQREERPKDARTLAAELRVIVESEGAGPAEHGRTAAWVVGSMVGAIGLVLGASYFGWIGSSGDGMENGTWRDRRGADVNRLLDRAAQLVLADHLTSPPGQNAVATYRAALALSPNDPRAVLGLQEIAAQFATEAKKASDAGDWIRAQERYESALTIDPESAASLEGLTRTRFALGRDAETGGDIDAALEHYRAAAEGGSAAAQLRVAEILEQPREGHEAQPDEAMRWYLAAAKSGEPTAQYRLWQIFTAREDADEADRFEADIWLLRAARQGHSAAKVAIAGRDDLAQQEAALSERITDLIRRAEDQIATRQLTEPAGDNAFATLTEALRIEPANPVALALVGQIRNTYLEWATRAEEDTDWQSAARHLRRANRVGDEDEEITRRLASAEEKLQQARTDAAVRPTRSPAAAATVIAATPTATTAAAAPTRPAAKKRPTGVVEKVDIRWDIIVIRLDEETPSLQPGAALVVKLASGDTATLRVEKRLADGLVVARPDGKTPVSQIGVGDTVKAAR